MDKQSVSARITNTGQSLVLRVEDGQLAINITGGPLAYKYQFQVYSLIILWDSSYTGLPTKMRRLYGIKIVLFICLGIPATVDLFLSLATH